jgi:hypothetical protein
MTNRIVNAINNNGIFTFDSNACLNGNTQNTNIKSKTNIEFTANENILLSSDKLCLSSTNSNILITSQNDNNDAIYLKNINDEGGILIDSGRKGLKLESSGDISLSCNDTIHLGNIEDDIPSTDNIILNSLKKISINTEDFYTIASDSINFISQSGDISFGSKIGNSFIKFENNNILINQQTSNKDRILDINVNKNDSISNSNGICIKSSNDKINSDIRILNDDNTGIEIGTVSTHSTSIHNYYKEYMVYQEENKIFFLNYINSVDTQRILYWSEDKNTSKLCNNISYSIKQIIQHSNFNITISLLDNKYLYNNNYTSLQLIIFINSTNTFTFELYDNKELTVIKKNIEINSDEISIDNFIISFPLLTGYQKDDYWKFNIEQCILIDTKKKRELQYCYFLNGKNNYINAFNNLQLNTRNKTRLNISEEGGISFNNTNCASPYSLVISNNYNKENIVSLNNVNSHSHSHSHNHKQLKLNNGGFIMIWEEQNESSSSIHLKRYLSNGEASSITEIVNQKKIGYHQNPIIANCTGDEFFLKQEIYIIVWSSLDNDIHNIYAQIYIDHKKKKGFDIPISKIYNNLNKLCLTATRMKETGNFIILWCGDDNNIGHYSIYGLIIDIGGNIIKDRFQISEMQSSYSYSNPIIYSYSDILGKDDCKDYFIVMYHQEYLCKHTNEIKYNLKYKRFESEISFTNIDENHILTTNNYVSAVFSKNTSNNKIDLYISFFDNFNQNINYKNTENCFIDSINNYNKCNIKIKKIVDNIVYLDVGDDAPSNDHSNDKLTLFKQNDIINIKIVSDTENNHNIICEIDLIDDENMCLILSKTFIVPAIYNFELISTSICCKKSAFMYCTKNNLNLEHVHKKTKICLIPKYNDIFLTYSSNSSNSSNSRNSSNNNRFTYKYILLDERFNTKYLENGKETEFNIKDGSIENINCNQIFTNNNIDSGILVSYDCKNKIMSNIGFKIINIYNDLFRIDGNNSHNSIKYKNDCLYIGKNNVASELSNSFMHLNGSCSSSIITVNCERYYVTNEDNTILADTSKNDITLILNNGKSYYGRIYNIKHIKTQIQHNSTTYKLIINSSTCIDGKNIMILDKINEYIRIQSDSKNWYII